MKNPEDYAHELWQARNTGVFCAPLHEPLTQEQAYAIQNACTATGGTDATVVGYKIGATNQETLGILSLTEPFYGPLYSSSCTQADNTNETVALYMQHKPRIEAEFVVCLKNDVQRGNTDITASELANHIDWVAPGIEIVASRFSDTPAQLGFRAIADFGANQHMLVGQPFHNWQELDLTAHPVTLSISNQPDADGHSGMSLFGNPVEFVCWLLNHPAMHATGLKAGQFVSCGTCTGAPFLEAGNAVTADYGVLGQMNLTIEAKNTA